MACTPSVLLVVSGLAVDGPLGGVARFVIELARALDQDRIRPSIAALWDYGSVSEQRCLARLQAEGIPTVVGAPWNEGRPYWSCVQALRGLSTSELLCTTDILHSHGEFSDIAAWWLRRRMRGCALVRTVHNEIEWPKRRYLGQIFGQLLFPLVFDMEWGVSSAVVERLNARLTARWRRKRAQVVYNAVDFRRFMQMESEFGQMLREHLGIPRNSLVLGTIGRLVPQKGYAVLLDALAQIRRSRPDVHLIMVGEGPLGPSLRRRARFLGLERAVHWLGARQDIERVLTAFDLFVSSSLWEGLPTVILEALAAGVPVVATRVSGTVELVDGENYGVLVPPGDPYALAEGLHRAIERLSELRVGIQAARSRLEQRFSIHHIARQYERNYHVLTDGGL